MKLKTLVLILSLMASLRLICQDNIRDSVRKFTINLVEKALKKNIKKISFWDFTDINNEVQPIGSYISELMSIYANDVDSVEVMDRQHLKTLLQEHQLKSEGFIDENTIMELGKFSDVDAVVVGTIIIGNKDFQILAKVLRTNQASTASSGEQSFAIDEKMASILGIRLENSSSRQSTGPAGRGFNKPINSNEQLNNSSTVNKECEKNNTGDYCFYNSTKYTVNVKVNYNYTPPGWQYPHYTNGQSEFMLKPGESKCIYGVIANQASGGSNHFEATVHVMLHGVVSADQQLDEGDFAAEKCKSKTYTIQGSIKNN
jgi:hypothetical protein